MRFAIAAAIVLTLTVGGGAVWMLIERNAALRAENATLQRNADTLERIDNAQDRSRKCGDGWYNRLRCSDQ